MDSCLARTSSIAMPSVAAQVAAFLRRRPKHSAGPSGEGLVFPAEGRHSWALVGDEAQVVGCQAQVDGSQVVQGRWREDTTL